MRCLALVLVWQMIPATGELAENVVHLLLEGHLAHALPDADHQPEDAEHSCSGPYHFCFCHTGPSFVITAAQPGLAPLAAQSRCCQPDEGSLRSGHPRQVFRPPIAA